MLNAAEITLACNQEPIPNGNYRVGHDCEIISSELCHHESVQETVLRKPCLRVFQGNSNECAQDKTENVCLRQF